MPPRPRRDDPPTDDPPPLHPALQRLPRAVCILTAAYDGRRRGLRVHFVQTAATEPPSVSIAIPKGQPISPLIRDARAFGLCIAAEDDTSFAKRFAPATREHHHNDNEHDDPPHDDPFEPFEPFTLTTGAPLLSRAAACLDCRVTVHLDAETDHELFIAEIVDARVPDHQRQPAVRTGEPD
jgi:flavin reductase (DIM6/NTAB) family NADH-FMN oxidoreductase RutF